MSPESFYDNPGVEYLSGSRPSAELTIANYVGGVRPIVDLQESGADGSVIFVADMHAYNDRDPGEIDRYARDMVLAYLSLGIDPDKTLVYRQSRFMAEILAMQFLLAKEQKIAELMRCPTLGDKLDGTDCGAASVSLVQYPLLMAADIAVTRARRVVTGPDQVPHIELARKVIRRLQDSLGVPLQIPGREEAGQSIMSLRGGGKMSKSKPNGAIFLDDGEATIKDKIRRAVTDEAGIANLFRLGALFTEMPEVRLQLGRLSIQNAGGKPVMAQVKGIVADSLVEFTAGYQARKRDLADTDLVNEVLEHGAETVGPVIQETVHRCLEAAKFAPTLQD